MNREACFYNLDGENAYFPMVASLSPKAFYSLPPKALRPKQSGDGNPKNSNVRFTSSSHQARPEEYDSGVDTHGVSSEAEDSIEVDTPQAPSSPQGPKNRTVSIQPPADAPYMGTPTRFGIHGSQFSHMPNQASQRQNGQDAAQLRVRYSPIGALIYANTDIKHIIRAQSKQVSVVRQRVRALFRGVQMNIQSRNSLVNLGSSHREPPENARECNGPRADFGMEDPHTQSSQRPEQRVDVENQQSQTEIDILNRRSHQMGEDSQDPRRENQEAQVETHQSADNERQGRCAHTQEPVRPNEMLQGQLDTPTADPASSSQHPENAQSETEEALRKRIQELEEEMASLQADVQLLKSQIRALESDNEKLKADFERPNIGLAAELQDILNLLANRELDVQLPNMADKTAPAEPEESTSSAERKRGNPEEGEGTDRAAKRLKKREGVDLGGSASRE
jgi:hypothetical protein